MTTIAWRIAHIVMGCFGMRNATHFGGPPVDYETLRRRAPRRRRCASSTTLRGLDRRRARAGRGGPGPPVRPGQGPFAEYPMASLVLHINREVIHHGAEISLLRDLYLHQK